MISVQNLTKNFGELSILKGINTTIRQGEVVAIIGPSGTGKSTFLRCLNLLERPSGGSISIDGENILDKKADVPKIRRKMGMVFQSFNLFAHLNVLDNLTLAPMKLNGLSKQAAEEKALELLKRVGLKDKAQAWPHELSGGQKQRVAIARCLAMDPEIILFDEPTSALDPTMVSEVLSVIRRLAADGMTMAIVTHEMDFARDVATRIFYMDEGIIYEEGPPAQLFGRPQREKTRAFINRIKALNYDINTPDFDIYALNAELEAFCIRHYLSGKLSRNLQLLSEEVISGLFKTSLAPLSAPQLQLTVNFAEKTGTVELILLYNGAEFDFFGDLAAEAGIDELSVVLARGLTESIHYTYTAGGNKLTLVVRG